MDALVNKVPLALRHGRAGDQPRDRDGRLRAQHRGRAHRARGRPGRDGERRRRHPLGPEDRLREHRRPRRCARTLDRAAGPDLRARPARSASSSRAPCTAGPTGPPRRSSARTRSPSAAAPADAARPRARPAARRPRRPPARHRPPRLRRGRHRHRARRLPLPGLLHRHDALGRAAWSSPPTRSPRATSSRTSTCAAATRSGRWPRPSSAWSPTCARPPTPPGASPAAT